MVLSSTSTVKKDQIMTTKDIQLWHSGDEFVFGGPEGPKGKILFIGMKSIDVQWQVGMRGVNVLDIFLFEQYAHKVPRYPKRNMRIRKEGSTFLFVQDPMDAQNWLRMVDENGVMSDSIDSAYPINESWEIL